jgi:hypothetical protein
MASVRRLDGVERGEHPHDGARPGIRILRQQAPMALRDVENDRSRLEEDEIAFLIAGNLSEGLHRAVRRFLHGLERNEADVIRLADFLKRPTDAHVARQPPPAIRRAFKGGDRGGHRNPPVPAYRTEDERPARGPTMRHRFSVRSEIPHRRRFGFSSSATASTCGDHKNWSMGVTLFIV